jgi:Tail-tube assembly protein
MQITAITGEADTTSTNAPLSSLHSNPFQTSTLIYPSNLGSSKKMHSVIFTIYSTQPASYDQSQEFSIKNTISNVVSHIEEGSFNDAGNIDEKTDLSFQPKRNTIVSSIALYMPDTVNFQYQASYSNLSLKDVAEEIAKGGASLLGSKASKFVSGITSIVDSGAVKLALSAGGYAINPQQQLLFDGIDFRTFQMAFTFTPRNQQEAQTVKNIIQQFRLNAAPLIQTGAAGALFIVPNSFVIEFKGPNGKNTYVNRVKESVLTNIDVNYSPNGIWSAHPDGAPVQTVVTLDFKEIALIDQNAITAGF